MAAYLADSVEVTSKETAARLVARNQIIVQQLIAKNLELAKEHSIPFNVHLGQDNGDDIVIKHTYGSYDLPNAWESSSC